MHKIEKLRDFWRGLDPYDGIHPDTGVPIYGFRQNMDPLKRALDEVRPKRILEIGSHCGASAIFMAENSEAEILCIDPWSLKADCVTHNRPIAWFGQWVYAFDSFRCAVVGRGLQDRITYLPMRSDEAFELFTEFENVWFDMAYVDGDHDYKQAINDIYNALSVAPIVVVDDCNKGFLGVERAVLEITDGCNDVTLKKDGNKAIIGSTDAFKDFIASTRLPMHKVF